MGRDLGRGLVFRILVKVATVVPRVLFVKHSQPEEFGVAIQQLELLWSLVSQLTLGFREYATRCSAHSQGRVQAVLRQGQLWGLLLTLLLIGISYILGAMRYPLPLCFVVGAIFLDLLKEPWMASLSIHGAMDSLARVEALSTLGRLAAQGLALVCQWDFVVSHTFGLWVASVLGYLAAQRMKGPWRLPYKFQEPPVSLGRALSVWAQETGFAYLRMPVLLLFTSNAVMGHLSLAERLVQTVQATIFGPLQESIFWLAVNHQPADRFVGVGLLLGWGALCFGPPLADLLVVAVFGPVWQEAGKLLQVQCVFLGLMSVSMCLGALRKASNQAEDVDRISRENWATFGGSLLVFLGLIPWPAGETAVLGFDLIRHFLAAVWAVRYQWRLGCSLLGRQERPLLLSLGMASLVLWAGRLFSQPSLPLMCGLTLSLLGGLSLWHRQWVLNALQLFGKGQTPRKGD